MRPYTVNGMTTKRVCRRKSAACGNRTPFNHNLDGGLPGVRLSSCRFTEFRDHSAGEDGGLVLRDFLAAHLLVEGGRVWVGVPFQPRVPLPFRLRERPLEE